MTSRNWHKNICQLSCHRNQMNGSKPEVGARGIENKHTKKQQQHRKTTNQSNLKKIVEIIQYSKLGLGKGM